MTKAVRAPRKLLPAELENKFDSMIGKPDWDKLIYLLRDMNLSHPLDTLTAARTYYVRTDGSDSNDGRADSPTRAFLTIQKAVDNLDTINQNNFIVTIQIGAGTYTEDVSWNYSHQHETRASIVLIGDEATPANVIIAGYYVCLAIAGVRCEVRGITFLTDYTPSSPYGEGMEVWDDADVRVDNCVFAGTGFVGITVFGRAQLVLVGTNVFSGVYQTMVSLFGSGTTAFIFGTISIPNALTVLGRFVEVVGPNYLGFSATISGAGVAATTGKRYESSLGGIINTSGGGASKFPGDVAGTTATGGQYV